jgi:heme a synthase
MSLDDFKLIYYIEWGHCILGCTISLAFILPLSYFALRRHLVRSLRDPLLGMAALLGAQGALGWYMVQSGLEPANFAADGTMLHVSQYHLAAHLGTVLVLYTGMFSATLSVKDDWRFVCGDTWARLANGHTWEEVLHNLLVRIRTEYAVQRTVTDFVFMWTTALCNIWNTFPQRIHTVQKI